MKIILALALCLVGCATLATADSYPDLWWAPVPADQLASWEVPPQAADRTKKQVILSKRNELGILSNFAATPFVLDGHKYASIEGLWQSMKYPEGPMDERMKDPTVKWEFTRDQVEQMTAFTAKAAGDKANANMKKMGITWITYQGEKIDYHGAGQQRHYEVIYNASVAKVEQNPEVKRILKATGDLQLLPDHHEDPNATPAYHYFDIYMKIRSAL